MAPHHDVTRRRFLTTSLSGLASAGLLAAVPQSVYGEETTSAEPEAVGEVMKRTLGRTGIKVPIVSMGVMNANAPDILSASFDLGVRHFDTAARYQYGRNEQMVGDVIRKLGVRDKVVIATKIMRPAQRGGTDADEVKSKIVELCEGSLRRLKMDYVDILYIHSVSSAAECGAPGTVEALAQLKEQGKIRAAGVSTHQAMAEVINEVTRVGFYDVVLTAINVAMADNTDLLTAIDGAAAKDIGIIAMKTQAGGQRLPNQDSLTEYTSTVRAQAALKWVMRNEAITTSIPGYDNFRHMREVFAVASDLEFTEEEQRFLSDNDIKLSLGFCHQCRECLPTCPRGVEVPGLMRTFMYAAQYTNFHEARATLAEIPLENGLQQCTECSECEARCGNQVDIRHRIETLKTIYA